MLRVVYLVLPALFPSWRFFKTVGPSPRVEVRVHRDDCVTDWREALPRPTRMRLADQLKSLFWSARVNQRLFLVTCGERLAEEPDPRVDQMLRRRLWSLVVAGPEDALEFRVVLVSKDNNHLRREIVYHGDPVPRGPAC